MATLIIGFLFSASVVAAYRRLGLRGAWVVWAVASLAYAGVAGATNTVLSDLSPSAGWIAFALALVGVAVPFGAATLVVAHSTRGPLGSRTWQPIARGMASFAVISFVLQLVVVRAGLWAS